MSKTPALLAPKLDRDSGPAATVRKKSFFQYLPMLLAALPQTAQAKDVVVFVLDASGSMYEPIRSCDEQKQHPQVFDFEAAYSKSRTSPDAPPPTPRTASNDKTRFAHATALIAKLADEYEEKGYQLGLVVFSHAEARQQAYDCAPIETLVHPTAGESAKELKRILGTLSPMGATPLAHAMQVGGSAIEASQAHGDRQLVVMSDGEENCSGNPIDVANDLRKNHDVTIHLVAWAVCGHERDNLQKIAAAGGGHFNDNGVGSAYIAPATAGATTAKAPPAALFESNLAPALPPLAPARPDELPPALNPKSNSGAATETADPVEAGGAAGISYEKGSAGKTSGPQRLPVLTPRALFHSWDGQAPPAKDRR